MVLGVLSCALSLTHTSTASLQIPGDTMPPRQGRLSQLVSTEADSRCWLVQLTDTNNGVATSEHVNENLFGKVLESSSTDTESVNLVSSSDGDEPAPKKKRVSFSHDSKAGPPEHPSTLRGRVRRKSRAGARSSNRLPTSKPLKNRKRKGACGSAGNSKRGKVTSEEPVTKVPMKTGTLYMYGGSNRRAEFVPHV